VTSPTARGSPTMARTSISSHLPGQSLVKSDSISRCACRSAMADSRSMAASSPGVGTASAGEESSVSAIGKSMSASKAPRHRFFIIQKFIDPSSGIH
jgi:hypothetical protein